MRIFARRFFAACLLLSALTTTCVHAIALIGVESRKDHAAAGTQSLPINPVPPIDGAISVEPRTIGSGHSIVFIFDTPITSVGGASATDATTDAMNMPAPMPIGMATPSFAGSEVTVLLTGIPDNTRVRVAVTGVNGALDVSASIGFLVGDVNGNRVTDASDVSSVKSRSGQATTGSTFRYDIGATGSINVADILATKARVGLSLPVGGQGSLTAASAGGLGGLITSMPAGIACPGTCIGYYKLGTMISLTAVENAGSQFNNWSGICSGAGLTTAFPLATSGTCVANFALKNYSVTPMAGSNGSITPNTPQSVAHGSTRTFTVTPNATYAASVTGCGGTLMGATYTTGAITGPCTVTATFALATYPVTPSSGGNGVINPSTVQNVTHGTTTTFTVTPNANYMASVASSCGGTLVGSTFTTGPVTAACTVSASFLRTTFQVTPSVSPTANFGTISPSIAQTVNSGSTISFVVTPNTGYAAAMSGSCGGTLSGTTFTTNTITGTCSVVASFNANTAKYVSTTGNDTTGDGTLAKPWKTIGKGIATMAGGDTLIVRPGTYTGIANFIDNVKPGTPTRYTTIMAETPFDVRIQSTTSLLYYDNALSLNSDYTKVDGFIFDMSGTVYPEYIGYVGGNYNKITRSMFKRSGDIDQYGGLLFIEGNDNLIEDVAGTGACRYCFAQGGPSSATQRTVWRRLVGRFDYSNSNQPKATFNSYGNDNTTEMRDHLYQNVIALDGQRPGNFGGEEKYAGFYTPKRATNVTLNSCIVLNEAVGYYGIFLREFNSVNSVTNSVIWDLPGSLSFASSIKVDNANKLTIGGTMPGGYTPDSISPVTGSLINPAVKPANLLNNTPGAVILKRLGVTGTRWGEPGYDQLTTEDLWPWPYQDRIKSLFRETNNPPSGNSPATNNTLRGFAANGNGLYGGPITLTSYIWEYLGTPCPATVCP